jgi:hypothetical protein
MPPKRNRKKPRSKSIRLSQIYWLRNTKDIKTYRDSELMGQEYRCAISHIPLDDSTSVLDHAHILSNGKCMDQDRDGRVRGVLQRDLNLLEGKYLKYFKKMKLGERFGLDFAETLVNMGEYLLQDNSNKPLHYKFMDDLRSYIKRLTKPEIVKKLKVDFNIEADLNMLHRDLVHLYTQTWVDKVEESLK